MDGFTYPSVGRGDKKLLNIFLSVLGVDTDDALENAKDTMGTMDFTSHEKVSIYTKPKGSQCNNYNLQHGWLHVKFDFEVNLLRM